jgi:YedE family putative selenium metabolism protein
VKEKRETLILGGAGLLIGVIAVLLVKFGNPANMGFCIACFLRDTAGALGLHRAAAVQYLRPEIVGLVLGAFIMALGRKEFSPKGGSAPVTRFLLAMCVMVGCLMFLGCPFRMVLRISGGDGNALLGLLGFACGIGVGVLFLKNGYSLKRNYQQTKTEGSVFPVLTVLVLVLALAVPALFLATEAGGGPGGSHAPVIISLAAGLIVGGIAQLTRLCMVGGIRDLLLFRSVRLLMGFVGIFAAALICNLAFGFFHFGFEGQPVAHNDGLWNLLGMLLAGYGCTLLGGCPLRQLVLTGEGNTDSAVTVLGFLAGAAFCHNFSLAASANGPTLNGKIAVVVCLVIVSVIALTNTLKKKA